MYFESLLLVIFLVAGAPLACALAISSQHDSQSSSWLPLPQVDRRTVLSGGAGLVTASSSLVTTKGRSNRVYAMSTSDSDRSVASIDSHVVIPVWPSYAGGRVVPVSLQEDPFLLLAHHKHWFDPRDPLRKPFQLAGKALGLPYVDVEGFSMHPHRGFDILTYVLDGSDGFRHRDSLNKNPKTYRGGTAQWMRTGSGVLHEEFWETRNDRRTDIELFQLWVNLPASQKMDEPIIQYIGEETDTPWIEETLRDGVRVRNVGATLDKSLNGNDAVQKRPPVSIQHVTMKPGTSWTAPAPSEHSAVLYVREGTATLGSQQTAKALQTASFSPDGESITIQNTDRRKSLDFLLLSGTPLREAVATGGPIVMTTEQELNDAYRQLQNGTFLKRNLVLREHDETLRRSERSA